MRRKVLNAEDQRAALELEIFNEIRQEIVKNYKNLQSAAGFLARLDCLLNLAEVADQNDYCRPEMTIDGHIHIEDGRHPVVEKMITGERFVPNTVSMDNETNQILIITGPNMAGKSTVLRQVALLVVMAQMGSFIPAKKGVHQCRRSDIYARRRSGQPLTGTEHFYGRNAGNSQYP